MPVIATAGHVDHGKSTLVRALTGRDPDRWEEEQRRGLTIDLGFAWTDLDGHEVGFIDVPGHERFIKNMLAGIGGVDAALFVVAADEGWMPQSEEHLAVLDLIGVRKAVIALTRVDLVSVDDAELAALTVSEHLEGTSLAGSEVVLVAAPTGEGLEHLRRSLAGLMEVAVDDQRPRLWIDRSFTIDGAGTVVTGTLTGGTVAVGATLVVHPGEHEVRVRGLQTHEHAVESIGPGNRAAINLIGVERDAVERGAMLGVPGHWQTTTRLLADLRTVRGLTDPVTDRGSFHAHIGSGDFPVRISLLEQDALRGSGAALISLDQPIPVAAGDHLILREVGRGSVIAGGIVLDPHPPQRRRDVIASLQALRNATDPDSRAEALLSIRGIESAIALTADSAGGIAQATIGDGDLMASPEAATRLEQTAYATVTDYHERNALRPGMPLPAVASLLGIGSGLAAAIVAASPRLAMEGPVVRSTTFVPTLETEQAEGWSAAQRLLEAAGFAAPSRNELGLAEEVLYALVRDGKLVRVGPDLAYLPETLNAIVAATASQPDGFSVAGFRDALGITRRHAVPLLEWMDEQGITRRIGDTRTLRRSPDAMPPGDVRSR